VFVLLVAPALGVATADTDHNHDHDAGVIGWFGHWHPVVVHFPIALVVMAALAEVLRVLKRNESYAFAARFMLYGAAFASVVAAMLGFAAAAGESYEGQQALNFTFHRILGVAVPVLIFLTLGLCESARRTKEGWQYTAYQALLFVTMLVVVMTAYLGGTLVFGVGHLF
jgi:uncharacterized membrane protein